MSARSGPAPRDDHDETLLGNVHPRDWVNPEPAARYHFVVLGAGTAGLVAAAGAAGLGAKVALVERDRMGGDCLNFGCVPSKAILRSARAAADARGAGRFGVRVPAGVAVDFRAVMERMRRLRARISPNDSVQRFRSLGVDVFLGEGRFAGPDALDVGGRTLRFRRAVIATGARPARPPIEGLAEAGFFTNETIFSLEELPPRLAVIGAGPIGAEISQAFRRFGAEVILLGRADQILPREDPDAVQVVAGALERDGVRVVTGCRIRRVERDGASKRILLDRGDTEEALTVDAILVGAGRRPNVEGLGLERAGVATAIHGIAVDDHLRTTNRRIYAAGDVCMETRFTHAADFAARIVIQNALFLGRKKRSALTIPWCTYTDPELAHVGLSEQEARRRGIEIDTFVRRLADVDRAVLDGDEEGFVKIHVRRGTDRIEGATVVARHAGEMIGEITLAMSTGVGLGKLASVIHPYPTQAEAIRQTGDLYNRTRLTPFVQSLLRRWLSWLR